MYTCVMLRARAHTHNLQAHWIHFLSFALAHNLHHRPMLCGALLMQGCRKSKARIKWKIKLNNNKRNRVVVLVSAAAAAAEVRTLIKYANV